MDPYLEMRWEDVHTRLIGYVADAIQPQLSDDLIARMEEKVYVEDESEIQLRRPDVRVVENPPAWPARPGEASTALLDEPVLLEPVGDPIRQRTVLIYDTAGKRNVTAIEILSPWIKKLGKAHTQYVGKCDRYLASGINLIEIDLIRTGDSKRMIGPYCVPLHLRTAYRVTVVQPELSGPYLYAIAMDAKLPTIKVPLRPQDTPAKLNLQELLDKAYQMGRYDRIDYSQRCEPQPQPEEEAWFDRATNAAGRR
jgi:hypothetical protein